MRNEIYATLDHKLSPDDESKHDKCPRGENSWCIFNDGVETDERRIKFSERSLTDNAKVARSSVKSSRVTYRNSTLSTPSIFYLRSTFGEQQR
ncbi:hypothetical protein ALC62_08087 [Cyphomyrmex costatus]|uniref:Uncharacterized protein n=1 Tax=Cyphomyrmex costatus TaxID=456900 RepID=A0A151IHK6_9HYME|nr:hypothetical protein ALC62_08087 [Cyphomyrmex costatus]